MLDAFSQWPVRRWVFAAFAAIVTALVVGLPTDVIPNPVFGRPVPVTWWSYPSLAATSLLGGLLTATYVGTAADNALADGGIDRPGRTGGFGGLMSFFAVGCPVCNKLVVLALGTVGAQRWFAPFQPLLAVLSLILLFVALRSRLRNANACAVGLV